MNPNANPGSTPHSLFHRKLLAVAIAQAMLGTVHAADIVVDDLADTTGGTGCTLRDAITAANTDLAAGGCVAGGGADTIQFDPLLTLPATITLGGTELTISSELTIQGPGAKQLSISAAGTSRVFRISDNNAATSNAVSLGSLTLTGGLSTGIGGALVNYENLTINASTLSGNTAAYGGAFDNRSTTAVFDSTLSDNSATGRGGAVSNYGVSVTLSNTTVSSNTNAFVSAVNGNGPVTIINSTLAENDGVAVFTDGATTHISNTVIANTTNGDDCISGALATNINNLIETGNCAGAIVADPQLGPLQDNGGPTLTHALLAGSPAINAGDNASCTASDQRGFGRVDGACDIGAFEVAAQGPDLVVTTLSDIVVNDGECALREAIAAANNDATDPDCGTGSGADTITFDPSIFPGTITLGGTELVLSSAMTLQGPGADQLTIDAGGASRVFNINDGSSSSSAAVTLDALTVSNGYDFSGGGIFNFESLTLTNSTLSGNSAQRGAAVYSASDGSLDINNSTLSANTADVRGGAILTNCCSSDLKLTNSTVSGNSTGSMGAAVHSSFFATMTLTNSTLFDNAGRGLYIGNDEDFAGTAYLVNSIIADSTAEDCVPTNSTTIATNVNNLIGDGSCYDASNLMGDPLLGPLQDNGGPTLTHAVLPISQVIDAGDQAECDAAGLTTDQIGRARSIDGDDDNTATCDIGAVEFNPPLVVDSLGDDDPAGSCSLREAIATANTDSVDPDCGTGSGADTITFDPVILPGTITLGGTELPISSELTIQGPGAEQLTISAADTSRVFRISDNNAATSNAVTLESLTLTGGLSTGIGGALVNYENLTINASTLSGNTARFGGAFDNRGPAAVFDSTLSDNSATGRGGAISSLASLSLINTTMSGNTASSSGGAINNGATLNVTASSLSGNSATDRGGAIYNFGTLNLVNSTVSGNTADELGGGIAGGVQNLTNSTLSDNDSPGSSLQLWTNPATLTNTIVANSANGVDCYGSNVTVINTLIEDDTCGPTLSGDPAIGPLQDNGGPTQTHAVLPGSPVIDSGDQAACDTAGLTADQTGMPRPIDGDSDGTATCDIGAFEFVDIFGPQATLDSAPDVASPGGTSYDIVISYTDDALLDFNSIDLDDITVDGPGGPLTVAGVSTVTGVMFTYTLTPPGGSWDSTDSGQYNIALNANEVFDQSVNGPNAADAIASLGTFNVEIAEIDVLGNSLSIPDGDTTPNTADGTDFGAVGIGTTLARSFTVANVSLGVLTISDVSVAGDGFSVSVDPSGTLGAAAAAVLEISFSPTSIGSSIGTVTINNDDQDEAEYTFSIIAEGQPLPELMFADGFEGDEPPP